VDAGLRVAGVGRYRLPDRSPDAEDSLDAWVRATWSRAVVYARSLLRDRPAAEDVVQECYCNLLRRADVYDLPRDGVRLLMKAISNACFNKNTRDRPLLSLSSLARGDNGDCRAIDPLDTGAAEPPSVVLHAELEQAIASALDGLPDVQRAAVELKSLGHSVREIADILGVTVSHAGVLIHRGRHELAQRLAPYLKEPTG
jgi:RNA polymerase sigma-70 factor (ECF subfamily)